MALGSDSLDLPRPFGNYTLIRRLAVGGMAEVYAAKARGIGGFEKLVAIKVIHPRYSEDDHFVQMLVEEAKITVQLNHVNIAQVFDFALIEDTYCIIMEFIEGVDAYKLVKTASDRNMPLDFDLCAYVVSEICNGLDYAHRKRDAEGRSLGIVHRDVSPQNILISFSGEVKVVDFGIAKAALRTAQTEVGVIKGKYYYMSPEQAWADPIDHRSDIFSAGILLYELLSGSMLYREDKLPNLLDKVRKAEIKPPSTRRPEIPKELDAIVMRALAKQPEDRYSSAHQFGQALTNYLYELAPSFAASKVAQLLAEVFPEEHRRHTGQIRISALELERADEVHAQVADDESLPAMRPDEFKPDVTDSVIFDVAVAEARAGRPPTRAVAPEGAPTETRPLRRGPPPPVAAAIGRGGDQVTSHGSRAARSSMRAPSERPLLSFDDGSKNRGRDPHNATAHLGSPEVDHEVTKAEPARRPPGDENWEDDATLVQGERASTPSIPAQSFDDDATMVDDDKDVQQRLLALLGASRLPPRPSPTSTAPATSSSVRPPSSISPPASVSVHPVVGIASAPQSSRPAASPRDVETDRIHPIASCPAPPPAHLVPRGEEAAPGSRSRRGWIWVAASTFALALLAAGGLTYYLLRDTEAALRIASTPAGAQVEIEGVERGVTPLLIEEGLDRGRRYEVTLTAPGFERYRGTVAIEHERNELIAVLTPRRVTVQIQTVPRGALLWVDDTFHARSPIELQRIAGSELRITAKLSGFADANQTEQIPLDAETHVIELTLNRSAL